MQANSWHHKLFHFHSYFWIWKVWKGREKITKTRISRERKKLFRWNKKHFSQLLKGYHLVKKCKFNKKIADTSFKVHSVKWAYLPLTLAWVKLNVRPEVSTEPTHFLTLMNNGKAFSSLDGMACSYQCSDQCQFLPGHWQTRVLHLLRP